MWVDPVDFRKSGRPTNKYGGLPTLPRRQMSGDKERAVAQSFCSGGDKRPAEERDSSSPPSLGVHVYGGIGSGRHVMRMAGVRLRSHMSCRPELPQMGTPRAPSGMS